MNIKFKKLILHNFLSFEDAEVTLSDRGYTLISGINNNTADLALSNGSGKSSIFSGLCFALTGETIQGLSSNLNNMFNPGDMFVSLDFSIDNDNYNIVRSRSESGKTDMKITINGEDKSGKGIRESQQLLEQYIPDLSSELVGEVIIIGQGMPHKFSNNTPAGRKELLEKLSHSDFMLEDIKERLDNRLSALKDVDKSLTESKIKLDTELNIAEKYLVELSNNLKDIEQKNNIDFDAEISRCDSNIKLLENNLKNTNENLAKLEAEKLNLEDKLFKLTADENEELNNETNTFNTFNVQIKTSIVENELKIKNLDIEINNLKNIKDICPTCGQKIPGVHKHDTSEKESTLKLLREDLEKLKDKDIKQQESYRLNCNDIKDKYKSNKILLDSDISKTKTNIVEIKSNIRDIENNISDIKLKKLSLEKDKNQLNDEIKKINNNILATNTKIDNLKSNILYIIKDIDNNKNHLDTLNKINTLIKRDFRGILLSNIISYINNKSKEYALDIFKTDKISFRLNGNNIDITYLDKPLEALSGGEQQKVNLITQFAIRSMMQDYIGFNSNILVLDEILDNLDSIGCDQVLNFITNKLSDIESIFIISHHADSLNIGNDSEIIVTKDSRGISSLYEK